MDILDENALFREATVKLNIGHIHFNNARIKSAISDYKYSIS